MPYRGLQGMVCESVKVGFVSDSFLCHRMNGTASSSILWPVFARKPPFCGHRMNKWALPSILWPGRQRWRSFLPAGAEENFFEGPVVSRRSREQPLYVYFLAVAGTGAGEGLGWGYFPSASRSSLGGSCCRPRITPPYLPAQTVLLCRLIFDAWLFSLT